MIWIPVTVVLICLVGDDEGWADGWEVGLSDGKPVGRFEGCEVGRLVVGLRVGCPEGRMIG